MEQYAIPHTAGNHTATSCLIKSIWYAEWPVQAKMHAGPLAGFRRRGILSGKGFGRGGTEAEWMGQNGKGKEENEGEGREWKGGRE